MSVILLCMNKKPINKEDYIRPEETFTDRLSKKEIANMLIDYEKVSDLTNVPLGTHIRYISIINGESKFRIGGTLMIKNLPDYIILSNGTTKWSVQTKDTTFFKHMNIKEIKDEFNTIIDDKDRTIKALKEIRRKDKEKYEKMLEDRDITITAMKKLIKDLKKRIS